MLCFLFMIPIFVWLFNEIYSRYFYVKCYSFLAGERLSGRTVLVTGASSGIGKEIAKIFFEHGCKVIMVARRIDELKRIINEEFLKSNNQKKIPNVELINPVAIRMDLSNLLEVQSISEKICNDYRVEILVNNAGLTSRSSVVDTKIEMEQRIMTVNFFSAITLIKTILNSMIKNNVNEKGHIIVVSSVQGRLPIPYRSSYTSTKHALQAYHDSLRAELSQIPNGSKIHVGVLSPGYVRTNISYNALNSDGSLYGKMDETIQTGYDPAYVAECCAEMVLNRCPEWIVSPLIPKLLIIIRTIIPGLYFFIMNRYAKGKNPNSNNQKKND